MSGPSFDGDKKAFPSKHDDKRDEVKGFVVKSAHIQCPIVVEGEELYGHVKRTYLVEGWNTLLCPTQSISAKYDGRGNLVPETIPRVASVREFDYVTSTPELKKDDNAPKSTMNKE